jgi:hypothetical protein
MVAPGGSAAFQALEPGVRPKRDSEPAKLATELLTERSSATLCPTLKNLQPACLHSSPTTLTNGSCGVRHIFSSGPSAEDFTPLLEHELAYPNAASLIGPFPRTAIYSLRRATIGLTFVALCAGRMLATSPIRSRKILTTRKVTGSVALTP